MNLELVENIVSLIGEFPVSEIEVTRDGQCVRVRRPLSAGPATASALTAVTAAASTGESEVPPPAAHTETLEAWTVSALMVGIFHHAEPPPAYAAEVRLGQVLGYIESMKLMNEVVAETGGHLVDVLVEEGAPVEYGQALFRLADPAVSRLLPAE